LIVLEKQAGREMQALEKQETAAICKRGGVSDGA
jgi:hypothetical protein